MAPATKKRHVARPRRSAAHIASLAYVISQDNRGDYLWEIVDSSGKAVVQSGSFASRDDAVRAAYDVHDSARLAHFSERDTDAAPIL